jgi:hypothetical protein
LLRSLISLWRGTTDRDAFRDYRARLLAFARDEYDLSDAEFAASYENRYIAADGRDLFLEYLLAVSKDAPSYLSDHPALLADRKRLYDRFGVPILTMRELRDKENERLKRLDSPLRM